MESALEGVTDSASLVLIAISLMAISGIPGLLLRRVGGGQRLAALLTVVSALLGLPASLSLLLAGRTVTFGVDWGLPFGPCELAIDPLSAFFLIPVFLVAACGAVYALGYWPAATNPATEPPLTFFYGLLAAAMAFLLVARNGVLFLIAWEVMAMAAYFLLAVEHRRAEVREAGMVYLIATHVGTTALLLLFSVLRATTGSFLFPAPHTLNAALVPAAVIFLAALVGFGAKAGLMPLHIWLPGAHANAPSHVSALMSGVMLKMGIYGILRTVSFFALPLRWWGVLLLTLGAASALLGIVLAAAQRDLKRLLACSSIENIGIVGIGIGTALYGQATGNGPLFGCGMAGALIHIFNHSLFKPLLFFGSGSMIHATDSRQLDRMGGLARHLPWTAALVLTGAVAICGLPPLNGFVGEFVLYLGFFNEALSAPMPFIALLAPVLALVGGIAVIAFVKLYGTAFLGAPRSAAVAAGHEAAWPMLLPMGLLAALCLAGGLFPTALLDLVRMPAQAYGAPLPRLSGTAELGEALSWLAGGSAALLLLLGLLALAFRWRLRAQPRATAATWGCGYLRPTPRIQYTGVSFTELLVNLFAGVVRPKREWPTIAGLAPRQGRFSYAPTETVLERLLVPSFKAAGASFAVLRRLQHGRLHLYMLYIFATVFLLMIWAH
ncbi:hydrogenase [Geotalea uraniireducens]|uniref:Hydrogenase n=1 Tax=Geotalea uraniireducens TaxID=351604 RepID=A0ABN6VNU9_9BACT|nr:proton-conducting transporter membrane subunit [Geotalea uraniireducens]BDV41890.1 hydrogenase [Geotalea uraniireducens]